MSGAPSEAEIQTQWKNAVNLLEKARNYADGTVAGSGQLIDVLMQSLEGEYTPALAQIAEAHRSALSELVTPAKAREILTPIIFEYAKAADATLKGNISKRGSFNSVDEAFRALWEYMSASATAETIQTRAIGHAETATSTSSLAPPSGNGSIVGDGTISRLIVDEYGKELEACHVESKYWRCRADQNSGTKEHAEEFEVYGDSASRDALLRGSYGSGETSRGFYTSRHAGTGTGGSMLKNSSFSDYSATASPKFSGWTETAGGANITQDTTNVYRSYPNASTDASLQITGGSGDVQLTQTIDNIRGQRFDPNTPYFCRMMVRKDIGTTGVGGNIILRLGGVSEQLGVTAMSTGWQEIRIGTTTPKDSWFRNFNTDPFIVEIEWETSTSGTLHIDDVILCPWDEIDGTYWNVTGGATPWKVDDLQVWTDTGGAAGAGILQWWLWVAGFPSLPSSGTPTIADPT